MKKIISLALAAVLVIGVVVGFTACDLFSSGTTEAEKLICGVTVFEPMNFKDENDEWTGFDTELAKLVADKLGMEVSFVEIEWDARYSELASGAINCIWNGFTANTSDDDGVSRNEKVDFSYSYMLNQQCIVVKADKIDDFKTINDIKGKKIAVETNSAGDSYASEVVGEDAAKDLIRPSSQIKTFTELLSGAADCAVVDILLAKSLVGSGDYVDLKIADIETTSEVYAIGFKIGSELKDKVNTALKELDEAGAINTLVEKYELGNSYKLDTTFTGK